MKLKEKRGKRKPACRQTGRKEGAGAKIEKPNFGLRDTTGVTLQVWIFVSMIKSPVSALSASGAAFSD